MKKKDYLVISLGDPAGIGMEVTLKALGSDKSSLNKKVILVGCKKSLEETYARLVEQGNLNLSDPKNLLIEDVPIEGKFKIGKPNNSTGDASFKWLTKSCELIKSGVGNALVTAPIAKHAWHNAGHIYPGQTERLAEISNTQNASMLFTAVSPQSQWRVSCILATTHIPFKDIYIQLKPELIEAKVDSLIYFCKQFKKSPKIAITGLNPHAGEEGKLGKEEIEWIIPLLEKLRKKHKNIDIKGPIAPDTCWLSSSKAWRIGSDINAPDGILSLYHDQGLIPMKLIAFDEAVNTTLGLPFIRTSPDHGTAFDISEKGIARHNSMLAAIKTAEQLALSA